MIRNFAAAGALALVGGTVWAEPIADVDRAEARVVMGLPDCGRAPEERLCAASESQAALAGLIDVAADRIEGLPPPRRRLVVSPISPNDLRRQFARCGDAACAAGVLAAAASTWSTAEIAESTWSEGTSFDCDAPPTRTDALICGDRALSGLDLVVANAYRRAERSAEGTDLLEELDRDGWRREAFATCALDVECLKPAFIDHARAVTAWSRKAEERAREIKKAARRAARAARDAAAETPRPTPAPVAPLPAPQPPSPQPAPAAAMSLSEIFGVRLEQPISGPLQGPEVIRRRLGLELLEADGAMQVGRVALYGPTASAERPPKRLATGLRFETAEVLTAQLVPPPGGQIVCRDLACLAERVAAMGPTDRLLIGLRGRGFFARLGETPADSPWVAFAAQRTGAEPAVAGQPGPGWGVGALTALLYAGVVLSEEQGAMTMSGAPTPVLAVLPDSPAARAGLQVGDSVTFAYGGAGDASALRSNMVRGLKAQGRVIIGTARAEGERLMLSFDRPARLEGDRIWFERSGPPGSQFFARQNSAIQLIYDGKFDEVRPNEARGFVLGFIEGVSIALRDGSPPREACARGGYRSFTVTRTQNGQTVGQRPGSLNVRRPMIDTALRVFPGPSGGQIHMRRVYEFITTYGCDSPAFQRLEEAMIAFAARL